jgi:hypothetical protein
MWERGISQELTLSREGVTSDGPLVTGYWYRLSVTFGTLTRRARVQLSKGPCSMRSIVRVPKRTYCTILSQMNDGEEGSSSQMKHAAGRPVCRGMIRRGSGMKGECRLIEDGVEATQSPFTKIFNFGRSRGINNNIMLIIQYRCHDGDPSMNSTDHWPIAILCCLLLRGIPWGRTEICGSRRSIPRAFPLFLAGNVFMPITVTHQSPYLTLPLLLS